MILFPEGFPKPTVNYNIKVDTSVARTKMETGRFRQRKRFTRSFRRMGVTWSLSDLEFGYFQSMYYHAFNSGADWFTIFLPMGDGLKEYTARFVADSYQATYDKVMFWNVSVALETEDETSPWSSAEIDALMAAEFDVSGFVGTVDDLHEYVHVTWPSYFPS